MMSRTLAVVVGIILIIGVGIPISQDVIDTANLTGLSATVVSFVPVFMAVGALVLSTRIFS